MWTVYAKLYEILDFTWTVRPVHPGISFFTLSRYFIKKCYINIYLVGGYETFSTKISYHFARFRAE